jgi:hypothetical protein
VKEVRQHDVKETRQQTSPKHRLCLLILSVLVTSAAVAQHISAPEPQTGTIIGTVTDVNEGTVPGATVALEGPSLAHPQRVKTSDDGFFKLDHLVREYPTMSPSVPTGSQTGDRMKSSSNQVSIWT